MWLQHLSAATPPDIQVPIQFSGKPGPIVHLTNPGGPVNLQWGPIQPVSQLGSQQLTSGKLAKNPDGSVTIWIAPTLPAGAPATNWIPTPSTAYYAALYPGVSVPTQIRPIIAHLLPNTGKQHAGVDPAPAEWVDRRHVRVPGPPEGEISGRFRKYAAFSRAVSPAFAALESSRNFRTRPLSSALSGPGFRVDTTSTPEFLLPHHHTFVRNQGQ